MSDRHQVWLHRINKRACDLLEFEGFEDTFRLKDGESVIDDWPSSVYLAMNRDHPTAKQLVDSLFNIHSLLVVSEPLARFLEAQSIPDLELLPVGIRDHKRKLIDEPYHIVNLTHHPDCLDPGASGARESLVEGDYNRVEGLVLRNEEALAGRPLFRLAGFGIPTIVTSELARAIDAEGFSGIKWGRLGAFQKKTW